MLIILWAKPLYSSVIVTEGNVFREDKEKNKDLLLVMWFVAPKSRTQKPREEDWVRPTKDVLMHATYVVELESCWSLYHLRNLLKITDSSVISD